ncbi:rhamnogalacturonan acetylesterase [Planctobacterium marinum]|uniref:rhamnogalacturonan acetylesterase n=1 Tax=Planctobacterium marinum TaxID=1631968 RepID=UPI001E3C68F5|nr:rhamnogalacturonan acetylesterase [Planctobacterium marinum]MCC2604690.1 rhamnogalacturonan acetylesterase [Planctobacterium marinum]
MPLPRRLTTSSLKALMCKKVMTLVSLISLMFSTTVMSQQLFMAGDSTMAIKHPKDLPETGWGVPFSHFFSDQLNIVNLAKNGRSTRTFMSEGLWQQIYDNLQADDFVFIQFGHNDEVERKKDRYTTPEQYQQNLTTMIRQVREKQAHAILMTPVTRRYFNEEGSIKLTHPYSEYVRQVAEQTGVLLLDMDTLTRAYFEAQGDALSRLRFMHIPPGLHPNYPNGVRDDTHFNELGAREVAQLVLQQLRTLEHPLLQFLRETDPKHLKLSY